MSVGILMDEHVPSAITEGLRRRGVDVLTVQEDGRDGLPDPKVLDRAAELGRFVFTQDQDFLAIGAARLAAGQHFSGIVFAHQMEISVRRCIDELEIISILGSLTEMENRIEFLRASD
jgi:predicted nuclease of predicted toxin-antitoxin system